MFDAACAMSRRHQVSDDACAISLPPDASYGDLDMRDARGIR